MMWQPPYFSQPPPLPQPPPPPPTQQPRQQSRVSEDWEAGSIQESSQGSEGDPTDTVGEDQLNFLDEAEALELAEFDVDSKEAWEPPKSLDSFLQKHFNRALSDTAREAIMKDYPKPKAVALSVPKLDDQIKDHLKTKGKYSHFGAEKTLYKIQESTLDVAGPLTCLWPELLQKNSLTPSKDKLLGIIQRSLVHLGSVSHQISQKRRKIAWTKINPKHKPWQRKSIKSGKAIYLAQPSWT